MKMNNTRKGLVSYFKSNYPDMFELGPTEKKHTDSVELLINFMLNWLQLQLSLTDRSVSKYYDRMKYLENKKQIKIDCDEIAQNIEKVEAELKHLSDTRSQQDRIKRSLKIQKLSSLQNLHNKFKQFLCSNLDHDSAEENYNLYSQLKKTSMYVIFRLEKALKSYLSRPIKLKDMCWPITKETIIFLLPKEDRRIKNDDSLKQLVKNSERFVKAFRDHHIYKRIQFICYSPNEKEFEHKIKMLCKNHLCNSRLSFILFGHGAEFNNTVGTENGLGIDRHTLFSIIDNQLIHFNINDATLLATECYGYRHHEYTYQKLCVKALVDKTHPLAISYRSHHISLMLHLVEQYVGDYY